MAEQIAVDLLINAAQSAKTVKEVRQAMKDLKDGMLEIGDEGSKDFQRLAQAGAELKDSLGDINDRMDAFNPDKMNAFGAATRIAANGVQLVTSAMALFGDQSEDVQKAMMKVQASMAFAQAIGGLKDLKKEFQTLFTFIQANPLIAIAAALAAIAVAAFKVYEAFQHHNSGVAEANRLYEKQKEITSALVAQYDREIAVLEASGASELDIIAIKRKKIEAQLAEAQASILVHERTLKEIEANDSLWESLLKVSDVINGTETGAQAAAINKAERAKEEQKALEENKQALLDLQNQLKILDIDETNFFEHQAENANAAAKANKEAKDKEAADNEAAWQAELALLQQQTDAMNADEQRRVDEKKAAQQKDLQEHAAYVAEKKRREQEYHDLVKARTKAEFELKKKARQEDLQIASSMFGALAELSGKNAKAQKTFAAAQTLVDTYLAAQKAYSSQLSIPTPDAPIRGAIAAAAAVISGIARMRKILAVNMDSPSGGGDSGGGVGGGIAAASTAPQVQPTTQLDANGNVVSPQPQQQQPIQAVMVESQARAVHTRVEMFETASRF